jgi:hypothetical protein
MRPLCLLLLCVAPLAAQDDSDPALEAFRTARAAFENDGIREGVRTALDALEKLDDPRALEAVVAALAHSVGMERRLLEAGQEEQRKGADAQDRLVGLRGEISLLRQRKEAGAKDVDEQIRKRLVETERLERAHGEAQAEWDRLHRQAQDVSSVRDVYAGACGRMLARAGDTDAGRAGIAMLRKQLDTSRPDHLLVLVRVIRVSGLKAGAPCLIEVIEDRKMDQGVARSAISALSGLGTRDGALALIKVWERDPDGLGVAARHALSVAARRRLADLSAAKAWAESLER